MMDKGSFLDTIRCRTDIQALIPVDAVMGIPLIDEDIWRISFYKLLNEKQYVIHSEIELKYPEGVLLEYRRIPDSEVTDFDEEQLFALKRDFIDNWKDEVREHDKYQTGI